MHILQCSDLLVVFCVLRNDRRIVNRMVWPAFVCWSGLFWLYFLFTKEFNYHVLAHTLNVNKRLYDLPLVLYQTASLTGLMLTVETNSLRGVFNSVAWSFTKQGRGGLRRLTTSWRFIYILRWRIPLRTPLIFHSKLWSRFWFWFQSVESIPWILIFFLIQPVHSRNCMGIVPIKS